MLAGQLDWRTIVDVPARAGVRQMLTGWRQQLRYWLCGMHGHERHIYGADGYLSLRCVYCGVVERGWEMGPPRLARRLEGMPGRHRLTAPPQPPAVPPPPLPAPAPVRAHTPLPRRAESAAASPARMPARTTMRAPSVAAATPATAAHAAPPCAPPAGALLAAAVVATAVACVLVGRASAAPSRVGRGPASAPHA